MDWKEDPEVWDSLDELMTNAWPDLKRFLDALNAHKGELDPIWRVMAFHGLGQMVAAYNGAKEEANSESQSFGIALESVVRNPAFSGMLQGVMNVAVDGAVEKMEEAA